MHNLVLGDLGRGKSVGTIWNVVRITEEAMLEISGGSLPDEIAKWRESMLGKAPEQVLEWYGENYPAILASVTPNKRKNSMEIKLTDFQKADALIYWHTQNLFASWTLENQPKLEKALGRDNIHAMPYIYTNFPLNHPLAREYSDIDFIDLLARLNELAAGGKAVDTDRIMHDNFDGTTLAWDEAHLTGDSRRSGTKEFQILFAHITRSRKFGQLSFWISQVRSSLDTRLRTMALWQCEPNPVGDGYFEWKMIHRNDKFVQNPRSTFFKAWRFFPFYKTDFVVFGATPAHLGKKRKR